jgi:hypothetical protein
MMIVVVVMMMMIIQLNSYLFVCHLNSPRADNDNNINNYYYYYLILIYLRAKLSAQRPIRKLV